MNIMKMNRLKLGMLLYKALTINFNLCHRICYCYISAKSLGILEVPTFSSYCNIRLVPNEFLCTFS